jgi:hypothetical protein
VLNAVGAVTLGKFSNSAENNLPRKLVKEKYNRISISKHEPTRNPTGVLKITIIPRLEISQLSLGPSVLKRVQTPLKKSNKKVKRSRKTFLI